MTLALHIAGAVQALSQKTDVPFYTLAKVFGVCCAEKRRRRLVVHKWMRNAIEITQCVGTEMEEERGIEPEPEEKPKKKEWNFSLSCSPYEWQPLSRLD